jgi:hypothetical protein
MESETHAPASDRGCPMGFIVIPAFLSGLVWLCALLAR